MAEAGSRPALNPAAALSDAATLGTKMLRGSELLSQIRDEDVAIATTPKDVVWQQDKVTLYHYRPAAEQKIRTCQPTPGTSPLTTSKTSPPSCRFFA